MYLDDDCMTGRFVYGISFSHFTFGMFSLYKEGLRFILLALSR